jgi:hypothetical protein
LRAGITGWFDLDYFGAVIAKDLGRERPGQVTSKVNNLDSSQRRWSPIHGEPQPFQMLQTSVIYDDPA